MKMMKRRRKKKTYLEPSDVPDLSDSEDTDDSEQDELADDLLWNIQKMMKMRMRNQIQRMRQMLTTILRTNY